MSKKSETSKVVKPVKTIETNDTIESLKEMLLNVEIVTMPRKVEIDEKTLKTSKDVAKVYSSINWKDIETKTGKQEFLIALDNIYKAYGEKALTGKNTVRKKINTPIFVSLSRELHKEGLDITQGGRKARMKLSGGKDKEVQAVILTPLSLKEYQELDSDGDINTKKGWIIDSLGKSILEEDLERNNMYLLNLEFYRPEGKEKIDNFSVIVEKDSDNEKKYLDCEEKSKEEAKNAEFVKEE